MRITVQRGAGNKPVPDELVADLACSEAPATQAGRNYLDAAGQDHDDVEISCWPAPEVGVLLPGDLAGVVETTMGRSWRGIVDAFSLTLDVSDTGAATLAHAYTLERPYA